MNVEGIEKLMVRRVQENLTDVEYLDESTRVIVALETNNPEEEAEKLALLECIAGLRSRARHWESEERDELAAEVEAWLAVPRF